MSQLPAVFEAAIPFICLAAVVVFARYVFPRQLAADGAAQVPRKWIAMILFVMLNVILYLAVVASVFVMEHSAEFRILVGVILGGAGPGAEGLQDLSGLIGTLAGLFPGLSITLPDEAGIDRALQAALIGTGPDGEGLLDGASATGAFIGGLAGYWALFGFRWWRQVAAGTLQQLHSINLIDEDVDRLDARLRGGEFAPAPLDPDLAMLDALERRVSEEDADDPSGALAVKCAKLEALLALWSRQAEWQQTLPRALRVDLDEIRGATLRRKMLAMQISAQVERVQNGHVDPEVLREIIDLISRHEKEAQSVVEAIRARVQGGGSIDAAALREILRPIIEYLNDEYDAALKAMTRATATSVAMSGDAAGERLKQLRAAGFQGLGRFDPIDPHVASIFAVAIFVAVSLILVIYSHVFATRAPNIPVLAAFAGSITLAVIAGVMVGGLRKLARRDRAPWGWYLLAAGVVAGLHVLLVLFSELAAIRFGYAAEPGQRVTKLLLIGTGIPVITVLAICVMAREWTPADVDAAEGPHGDRPSRWQVWMPRIREGCWDGLRLAVILAVVAVLSGLLASAMDVLAANLERTLRHAGLLGAIGLFIGFLVVGRVRKAAQSRLVREAPERPAPSGPGHRAMAGAPLRPQPAG